MPYETQKFEKGTKTHTLDSKGGEIVDATFLPLF